jgi:mono/diheme cytochrome c family protein
MLLAPGVTDGQELYEIGCAGCHGFKGEGLFAIGITGTGISKPAIRSYILDGIPLLGMPSFKGQFDSQQLDSLVDYLAALSAREIEPPPDRYPLPPPGIKCDPLSPVPGCEVY